MIYASVFKCVAFLHVVVAVPFGVEFLNKSPVQDNLRMTSPSYVRSEDIPTSGSYTGRSIFNVPVPDPKLIGRHNIGHPQVPETQTLPHNVKNNNNNEIILNRIKQPVNRIETKYLQSPYENKNTNNILSSPQLQQAISSEIYQNINRQTENTQTPNTVQKWRELYPASPTLQKLLSNPSLIHSIFAPKPQQTKFILVYPNGTIGYEDNLTKVSNEYPNHIILSSSELKTLSQVDDGNLSQKTQKYPNNIQNIDSNNAVSTINNSVHNDDLALGDQKSNSQHNAPEIRSNLHNNLKLITTPPAIAAENIAHNIRELKKYAENSIRNSNNQIVGNKNVQDSKIAQVIDTITKTLNESKNTTSAYTQNRATLVNGSQEYPSQSKTPSNKVNDMTNPKNKSRSDTIYIGPINQTSHDYVANFQKKITDSSYRSNELNNTQYATNVTGSAMGQLTGIQKVSNGEIQSKTNKANTAQILEGNNIRNSNITQGTDTITTVPDDTKNVSSVYIENSRSLVNASKINLSESKTLDNTNNTSQKHISYEKPINEITLNKISNSENNFTDSSYHNELNSTRFAAGVTDLTTALPAVVKNVSYDDTQISTTTAHTAQILKSNNITQVIATVPDDSKNISSVYIENSTILVNASPLLSDSKTTLDKVDTFDNTNNSSQNHISHVKPIIEIALDKIANFKNNFTDSSHHNELNNTHFENSTAVLPVVIKNVSNVDTQNSTTAEYTATQAVSTANYESLVSEADTIHDHNKTELEESTKNKELSAEENKTANKPQGFEADEDENNSESVEDNNASLKLDGVENLSWVTFNKEETQKMLFGEDSPNIFFIFYNPAEFDTERETITTTYSNGTVVEEYIEIRKMTDGTTLRTSTTKTYNTSLNKTKSSDNG